MKRLRPLHAFACSGRWVSPSTPRPGQWYYDRGRQRESLQHRGHLVADGDGRHRDQRRSPPQRPPNPGSATLPQMPGIMPSLRTPEGHVIIARPGSGPPVHRSPVARARLERSGAIMARFFCHLLLHGPRRLLHRRRLPSRCRWLPLDHGPGRRRAQRVSGHRMGTAEFESVHRLRGRGRRGRRCGLPARSSKARASTPTSSHSRVKPSTRSRASCVACRDPDRCTRQAGSQVQIVPGLPKTRSGKVMRRILRKIAEGRPDELGDVSTLADPTVVDAIKAGSLVR